MLTSYGYPRPNKSCFHLAVLIKNVLPKQNDGYNILVKVVEEDFAEGILSAIIYLDL